MLAERYVWAGSSLNRLQHVKLRFAGLRRAQVIDDQVVLADSAAK
jgi:hypothetical protein